MKYFYMILLCVGYQLVGSDNERCAIIQLPLELYQQFYAIEYYATPLATSLPSPPHLRQGACGVSSNDQSKQIVNGNDAPLLAWPWQVLVVTASATICGGSILTPEWVLTAAHCLTEARIAVGYGHTSLYNLSHVKVKQAFPHEEYDEFSALNDIALLKLAEPIEFSDEVRPVCLPEGNIWDASPCFAMGWGRTSRGEDGESVFNLRQIKVNIMNQTLCYTLRKFINSIFTDGNFCIDAEGSTGVYKGDSGGSLSCLKNGKYYVLGVTHMAASEGHEYFADSFTAVSKYVQWIAETIKANSG
ncbi:brachyurin-like [Physella acuta]|uniref:brachyurin-like n=1 Tax=Physella acuta TaxID=109671 RepID=UPI0027DAC3B0|nr:brachyurin-like [Physella acuta]XP_059160809.1 brachyurin-like [Physella acuta]XP_059160810.1 brachyurin-like [Physella acuta]